MSFGLRVWGEDGALQMNTDDFTYQVIHNQQYQAGINPIVVSIPGFTVATGVASLLPVGNATAENALNAMPYIEVYDGGVTIRGKHPQEPTTVLSTATVRLLVMRYR